MPSPVLTEADRAEIEKAGNVKLSPELWAALCSLQRPEPEHLPEEEGTYQNVVKRLKRRAKLTQRMIEEFGPRSPAGCIADEAIGEAFAKIFGPFDRTVFLPKLARLKLAIDGAVADLRRPEGGQPHQIPNRYAALLDIYCRAGGRRTDYVGGPCVAFLRCAHGKLGYGRISLEGTRAKIKAMNKILDGIQAGLDAK